MRQQLGIFQQVAHRRFTAAGPWLVILLLVSCGVEPDTVGEGKDHLVPEPSVNSPRMDHVCGASVARNEFCPTDFVRLAAAPMSADGKELWILGYLVVDGGEVALFASEHAYKNMEYGRSIRIEGSRSDLASLISHSGYQWVRIAGKFRANSFQDPKNDRLGTIVPPVEARHARPRADEREGIDDILVGSEYLQSEDGGGEKSGSE